MPKQKLLHLKRQKKRRNLVNHDCQIDLLRGVYKFVHDLTEQPYVSVHALIK